MMVAVLYTFINIILDPVLDLLGCAFDVLLSFFSHKLMCYYLSHICIYLPDFCLIVSLLSLLHKLIIVAMPYDCFILLCEVISSNFLYFFFI
jgi:hypothetical protein